MCQDMVSVTLTGLRLASSAAVADKAAATGTWPAWENAVIGQSKVDRSRVRVLKHRWPTQNLDQVHQQNHRLQQMRRINRPGGARQR